jgi:hypothetical protein
MSTKFVISFSGAIGAGKTSCCNFLRDRHGATILNFADGLKGMVCDMYQVDLVTLNANKDRPWAVALPLFPRMAEIITKQTGIAAEHIDATRRFKSYREVLQYIGTDIIRKHCPNWHIDNLAKRAAKIDGNIAIGDTRFPDELAFVKNVLGGHTIYLARGSMANGAGAHSSETSIIPDMCDEVILNERTEDDLHATIPIQ